MPAKRVASQGMGDADANLVHRRSRLAVEKIEIHRLSLSVPIGGIEEDSWRAMVNLPLNQGTLRFVRMNRDGCDHAISLDLVAG